MANPVAVTAEVSDQRATFDRNLVRFAAGSVDVGVLQNDSRVVSAILNTEAVALDNHIVRTSGLDTTTYMETGGLVPFCHKTDEPPVARMLDIERRGTILVGRMQFADAETYPFADSIYRLIVGKYLNATSIGWLPIEWEAASDRSRPGGLNFIRSRLLEVSIVPLPANPAAIITARSAGINVHPLYEWTEKHLDAGDVPTMTRADLEALRKAARMPKTAVKPKAQPAEPQSEAPATQPAQAVIDAYHKKIADEVKEPERGFAALARKFHKRDLFSLASFCYFLAGIENLYDSVAEEAAREDDGSDLPAKLRTWIDDGNRILLEMAGEETAEQIAGTQDDKSGAYYWSAATLESALARALDARGLTRKGAKYSADTVRCLRAAHDHVKKAHEQLGDMLDDADNSDPETNAGNPGDDPDDDDSRAARKAKADALKARIGARR